VTPRKERWLSVRRIALFAWVLVLVGCARSENPLPGYTRSSVDEHASIVHAIVDYYAARQRAVMFGDAALLFDAYPKLAHGENLREGINLDALFVKMMRDDRVTKVTDELERYEPVRSYIKGNAAVGFVHGVETWHYHGGPGSGEFFTRIDLASDAERWVVERTDEQMMGERRPRTPNP
jgi:hypothetical protein